MLEYPTPFKDYPLNWVEELAQFTEKADVIRLERKEIQDFITSQDLIKFYTEIERLSAVDPLPELPPMPANNFTFLYTIPKKQHEIKKLAPFVNAFCVDHKIEKVVDIGGGIGKFAQILNNQYGLRVVSVDMDPVLQATGRAQQEKKARRAPSTVEYVTALVDQSDLTFQKLLDQKTMTLGLHTCGPLANHQIITSARHKISGMINFGCCYHKLEHDPLGQNISEFTKSHPDKLEFGHFALTLSARAHRKMDETDYDLKQKVKAYRYAIHFLLHDEYGQEKLLTLGNSSPKLYDEDFGTYALEQLTRVQITPKHTKAELNAYFLAPERQKLLWNMTASGLLRNAMGRLLEMYILLDRAIYLEEQGYRVSLKEFFEEGVSPRNLGIVAFHV